MTRMIVSCATLGTAPLYGHLPRTVLEADYRPRTPAQFARARQQALRARTYLAHHDVVVEDCEADKSLVHLYPSDVMPYPWRTFWRKREGSSKEKR